MNNAPSDPEAPQSGDPLDIMGLDHVQLLVGNAKQAAGYYGRNFGFDITQRADLKTGSRKEANHLLEQGDARLVLTTGYDNSHIGSEHVALYGDGVRDIAFAVRDARAAYEQALQNGAESAYEPYEVNDENGAIVKAGIRTFGRVIHSFVERQGDFATGERFGPHFEKATGNYVDRNNAHNAENPVGLRYIDHIVGNVEEGQMNRWVEYYEQVLGFSNSQKFDISDISTKYSALMSKVMESGSGKIKIPINEPAYGKEVLVKKSQIEEYLDYTNHVPGVQHIALGTGDIIASVEEMQSRGLDFLDIPSTYYDSLAGKIGEIREKMEDLRRLGILGDRDDEGYLLQLFTKPVQDRPTLFYELIQRRGSRGFGKGNFKSLFEAIEQDQAQRGNLTEVKRVD